MLNPDVVVVPKLQSGEEVAKVSAFLDEHQRRTGHNIRIFVVIETLEAYRKRDEILAASKRNCLATVGYEDLCEELDIERPVLSDPSPLSMVLMETLISARRAGVPLIDAVSRILHDNALERLREEAEFTKSIGCCGKISIHPNQIPVINEIFDDTPLLERFTVTVDSFAKDGQKASIVNHKGEMEGAPAFRRATAALSRFRGNDRQ